jgi:methylenetetrahydrofolate reductase (NADPH)
MRIDDIISARSEPVFSFEFFPPKTDEGAANLEEAMGTLQALEPSFASVTYGAGGSTRDNTIAITKRIKGDHGIEAMAHLTLVGATTDDLRAVLDQLAEAGIDNVLALRGDPPAGQEEWRETEGGLKYSVELAELIRDEYPFCIGAACFPEVHPSAPDLETDLRYLKRKVDSGVSFLITQLFFDNRLYFDFVDAARGAGIDVPIIPGIIPVTSLPQLRRMTSLCGSSIPSDFLEALELRDGDPDSTLELGVAYATLQCAELLRHGAPGIHFYTINRSPATRAILSALKLQRPWVEAVAA